MAYVEKKPRRNEKSMIYCLYRSDYRDEPTTQKQIHMDYYESAEEITITRSRAFNELNNHGVVTYDEFLNEMGDKDTYDAQEVLAWLGY